MDPAQEIELNAQRYHKPMDELIARGDSPVQQFYSGATVFVTGGSGFLGKQLIEKLFRSCAIKKMYLLTRSKKGKTIQERLDCMLSETIFDRVRETQPNFASKIIPVKGDVAEIRLGLSDSDWALLAEEVNIIFHEAATIGFNESLRKATLTNVRGTRETLALAKQCRNLKKFIHVSTAFTHATIERIDTDVSEQFYPSPVPPHTMIALAEDVDENRLDSIENNLIKGWPNTYTFTKAITEELVRTTAGDLPVCIVRPSIVLPAYFEPYPGWLDTHTVIGPSGVFLGSAVGILHVFLTDVNANLPMIPVDYINNATITAAWDSTERQKNGQTNIPIYHVTRNLRYGLIGDMIREERYRLNTPKAIWYAESIETRSKYLYFFLSWFYHFIPAYVIDFVCKIFRVKMPSGMTSLVDVYRKIDKLAVIYNYFIFCEWNFTDHNTKSMISKMSEADKAIFNCDVSNIDLEEYILVWAIGLRKYILKDELKDTLKANRKQRILYVVQYIVIAVYLYILWYICCKTFMLVKYVLSCF